MSEFARVLVLLVSLAGLGAWSGEALAAAKFSRASAGWSTAATWSTAGCGGAANTTVPGAADDVTICTGHTITTSANSSALSLTIQTGGTLTQATNRTLTIGVGGLNVAGALTSRNTLTVNGVTTISGTLNITSTAGTKTFVGAVTVNPGGTWSNTANEAVTFRGGLTHNGATFTAGTGVHTFNTNSQTIGGSSAIAIPSVTVTGVTLTNNGTLTVATALSGTGGLTNSATGILNIGNTSAITTLTASAAGNIVNYNRAGTQTIKATTYHHLTLSGTSAKTSAAGLTVNGDFTLSGTASFTASTFTHNFAGNWIVNTTAAAPLSVSTTSVINFNTPAVPAPTSMGGTTTATIAFADVNINNTSGVTFNDNVSFSTGTTPTLTVAAGATLTPAAAVIINGTGTLTGSGTVQVTRTAAVANFASQYTIATKTLTNLTVDFAGVGTAQTVDVLTYGSATGGGLKVSNASGVGLTANTTVAGTLTLENGVVNAGAFTLIGSGDCTTKLVRTGGHVAGLLQLAFPTGAPSCTFHVGDATAYRPINVSFASVSVAGSLAGTVSQAAGEHPNIATSGLDSAKDVNRYWTLTNPAAGTIAYTTYAATFNFINPADFDAGATPASFEIERWDGAAWNVTTLGSATSTSTSASGLPFFAASSSNSFALGEKKSSTVVSINRADADPTSAATVSWTVTFDKSVTGVDATAFTLAPTGVSGAYITTVTGSGTTWTVSANTGIGAGTLGLNQTGPGSVVPTLTGTFTGQFYTITASPALAEYRMDEASWNGTANEVADNSGNGNHAQAFNSASTDGATPAIAGSPGTCRYGVFDNGATITQGYVQTPLPNLTTDFTVTAWIRTTNNTVGAQRILLDDQNNTGGYGFSLGEAGTGLLRFYSRGIAPIILDSTYTIANNTWYFVAAVADITNQKRTIHVYDAAGTLLSSTTEAAWTGGAWGTDAGPVSIGAETNASGEPPAANHFKGNLDEVRVYGKVLSQPALAAIATQSHTCPINVPDHLEIQSSGSGLTCAASTLTIKACTDAAVPCVTPYTLGVSGTLSAAGAPTVNWDGTTGGAAGAGFVIPNGSSSVTKDVQVATAGTVVFGVSSATPTPTNATACNFGAPACTFTANTAGFIFSDTSSPGNVYTIPAQVSGIATPTLYLRAVQASTTNPAVCTPAIISQTTPVDMGYVCNNPASCQPGSLTTINATAVSPGGTPVSLTFDANGSAPITARYDDAGQITLNASKTVTPFGGATPITLNGSSNAFVVKPDHFDLSGIQQTAAPNLANPAAADATGNKFVKAGEDFTVTVTARNFANAATPNYGQEITAESVKLTSALVGGLGLTNNPAVGGSFGAFTNGVATGTTFTWSEVGIITLTPSVGDGDYLGEGNVAGTTSGNVGRFFPDHFVATATLANRSDLTCAPASTFTYMGEPMLLTLTLDAQNLSSGPTQNYAGSFAKLDGATAGKWTALGSNDSIGLGAVDGTDALSGRLAINGVPTGSWTAGTGTLSAGVVLNRDVSADGAFENLKLGIAPQDADGVMLLPGALDLDADLNASLERKQAATTKVRYGRVRLNNAHGSELLALPVPLKVEYYNSASSGFVTNTDDGCTVFALAPVVNNAPTSYQYGDLLIGNPTGTMTVDATTPTFASNPVDVGLSSIGLSKPSSGKHGSVDVTLTVSAWLQYAWGSGSNPSARATFGVYKGNNEFIYLRETY